MRNTTVGFVGLGRMGSGMVANLATAGVPLSVFDLDDARVQAAEQQGARVAPSLALLAGEVQTLFLCLPDAAEVRSVLFAADGVLGQAVDGLRIVDTTTMNRLAAKGIAADAAERGAQYSDCPISGMPFRAADGSLTVMFGGSETTWTEVKPYLDVIGNFVVHCGEVGSGQLMKAINNVIYDINIAALCELLPLAVKGGLPVDTLAQVLTSASGSSFASEYFVPRILAGNFAGDFSMRGAYKDITNVQELATGLRASTPMTSAMVSVYRQAMAMGYGEQPKSAMIKVFEQMLDVSVRSAANDPDGATPNP